VGAAVGVAAAFHRRVERIERERQPLDRGVDWTWLRHRL
jgi:hypothetical protein